MLRTIRLNTTGEGHPFELPLLKNFEELELEAPVTFLVGENGSGKSTLLESLAIAAELIVVGGADLEEDPSLEGSRNLAKHLRLSWSKRTRRGFFMRAEDFFGFTQRVIRSQQEHKELAEGFKEDFDGHARDLAVGVARSQAEALSRYEELARSSHGEGFLHIFRERLRPQGLYLLDEPEAALSPMRQLSLLALIKDMATRGAQFVIATHSPIIMAYREAIIYSLDQHPIQSIPWKETEHVSFTRDFLARPENYLRHL